MGGILDFVLRLGEDGAEHARFLAKILEGVPIMVFQRQPVKFDEAGPVIVRGDGGLLVVRWASALIVHLEEQKEGELLNVVAIGDAIVAEQVAVIPDFVDESGSGGGHQAVSLCMTSSQVQLNTICCPGGQAAPEKILIFGPDWSL